MSISSTVKKFMPYIKTAKDYVLLRLSSQAVEMDDGTTLEAKVTSLNSLISKKLNSANVVNNLTTTNAGYALDARQGKSLSDKITQLNSALEARTNGKVMLFSDNEGGNIQIESPAGIKWQIDCYNDGALRLYKNNEGALNPFYYFSEDISKGGTVATEQYINNLLAVRTGVGNNVQSLFDGGIYWSRTGQVVSMIAQGTIRYDKIGNANENTVIGTGLPKTNAICLAIMQHMHSQITSGIVCGVQTDGSLTINKSASQTNLTPYVFIYCVYITTE